MNHTGLPCHTLEVALGRAVSINSRKRSHIVRNASGWACEYAAIGSSRPRSRSTVLILPDCFMVPPGKGSALFCCSRYIVARRKSATRKNQNLLRSWLTKGFHLHLAFAPIL